MICEVPVLGYIQNLVLLEFERHVNHFSMTTLAAICAQSGFELIESGHVCSRPFGLLAVFRKSDHPIDVTLPGRTEYIDMLACLKGGIHQVDKLNLRLDEIREAIMSATFEGKKVTIWAVNDILRRLLLGFTLLSGVIVVDSDPRRHSDLKDFGVNVQVPSDCIDHISSSDLFVISAARYKHAILGWVKQNANKQFDDGELLLLGAGASGETLT